MKLTLTNYNAGKKYKTHCREKQIRTKLTIIPN